MMMFMWSPTDVVFWEAIAHSIRGLLALSTYICYIVFNLGEKFVCSLIEIFVNLVVSEAF